MITLTCALYHEAAPLLTRFHLKKIKEDTPFPLYLSEEKPLRLLITGAGMLPAASAVTWLYTKYNIDDKEHLINLGTCCGLYRGELYLGHKIWDMTTAKTFYPDMICRSEFKETEIATNPTPMLSFDASLFERVVYDMEAAAVYQAGIRFLGPHQMSFLKIVSDRGQAGGMPLPSPEEIRALIEEQLDRIQKYMLRIEEITLVSASNPVSGNFNNTGQSDSSGNPDQYKNLNGSDTPDKNGNYDISVFSDGISTLAKELRASETMRLQLKQVVTYFMLEQIDYQSTIQKWREEGRLPAGSRREGKLLLEELKQLL